MSESASEVRFSLGDRVRILGTVEKVRTFEDDGTFSTGYEEVPGAARTKVERLAATVRRVRELHRESHGSLAALYPNPICECGKDYPCPTIRDALTPAPGHAVGT